MWRLNIYYFRLLVSILKGSLKIQNYWSRQSLSLEGRLKVEKTKLVHLSIIKMEIKRYLSKGTPVFCEIKKCLSLRSKNTCFAGEHASYSNRGRQDEQEVWKRILHLLKPRVKTRGHNSKTVTGRCSQKQIDSLKGDHCPNWLQLLVGRVQLLHRQPAMELELRRYLKGGWKAKKERDSLRKRLKGLPCWADVRMKVRLLACVVKRDFLFRQPRDKIFRGVSRVVNIFKYWQNQAQGRQQEDLRRQTNWPKTSENSAIKGRKCGKGWGKGRRPLTKLCLP